MPFGPLEIVLLLAVIALIFGAGKLPQLMKGLGQGVREFKHEVRDPAPPPPLSPQIVTPAPEVPASSSHDHR